MHRRNTGFSSGPMNMNNAEYGPMIYQIQLQHQKQEMQKQALRTAKQVVKMQSNKGHTKSRSDGKKSMFESTESSDTDSSESPPRRRKKGRKQLKERHRNSRPRSRSRSPKSRHRNHRQSRSNGRSRSRSRSPKTRPQSNEVDRKQQEHQN